jgi:dynein heavy chain
MVTLEKFAQKKPHWTAFEEKLSFYTKLSRDVAAQLTVKDVGFMRVNFVPLQQSVAAEAQAWINCIGM